MPPMIPETSPGDVGPRARGPPAGPAGGRGLKSASDTTRASASSGRFVCASRHRRFRGLEADFRMRPVAERLLGRAAAPAQINRPLGNRVGGAIPIGEREVFAVDLKRSALRNLDV